MILYHTGPVAIPKPDIRIGRKNADFGQGFYLTPDRDFALRWAGPEAVLNEYELDESGLVIHRFVRDEDWFDCLFRNRRGRDGVTGADVVIGPIANDTLFDTLGIISSGFLEPAQAMRLLMIGPEYTQVAVKTDRAAARLRYLRSERIERQDEKSRLLEQEAYQTAFAAAMEEMLGE
ncbi:MAG: DUF3990 domain-containing protein [Clostridia bacterium]|nr:DUF3990 domain-containing protein [Clostridia bacterium]